jgi:hypothetical protein
MKQDCLNVYTPNMIKASYFLLIFMMLLQMILLASLQSILYNKAFQCSPIIFTSMNISIMFVFVQQKTLSTQAVTCNFTTPNAMSATFCGQGFDVIITIVSYWYKNASPSHLCYSFN